MKRPTTDYEPKFNKEEAVLEKDDFEIAKSIQDIEETLGERGELEGLSGKVRRNTTYRKAVKDWRKLNRKDIGRVEADELPSYSTKFNGDKIHVHGYNHGLRWLPNSKEVRELFTETARKHSRKGRTVLIEENLFNHLEDEEVRKRPKVKELDDVKEMLPRWMKKTSKDQLPEEVQDHLKSGFREKISGLMPMYHEEVGLLDRALDFDRTLRMKSMAFMARFSSNISYEHAKSMDLSRKDADYSLDHLNFARSCTLPLRFLEERYKEEPQLDVLEVQRSIYQAEKALQEPGDTHLIVGTGHVPQIEDYIDRVKEYGRRGNLPPR